MTRHTYGARPTAADVRRPWLPRSLAAHGLLPGTVAELSYLVVEEMMRETRGALTTITISPWPAADAAGRLRFALQGVAEVTMLTDDLEEQLYSGWLARGPRIGDVFAARVDPVVLPSATRQVWREPLGRLLTGGVYDISEDARTVAKLALYAARTDLLSREQVARNQLHGKVAAPSLEAPVRRLVQPPGRPTA